MKITFDDAKNRDKIVISSLFVCIANRRLEYREQKLIPPVLYIFMSFGGYLSALKYFIFLRDPVLT